MRIFICVWQKKYFYVFLVCIDMIQTSEQAEPSERAEQIWSGWS